MVDILYRQVDSYYPLTVDEKALIKNAKTLRETIPQGHGIQIELEKVTIFDFDTGAKRMLIQATNGMTYKTMSLACIDRIERIITASKSSNPTVDIVSKLSAKSGNYYLYLKEI